MPTSPPLHRLVYQSSATVFLNEHELEAVLTKSRAWNTAHGLTGLLLHCDGGLLQVLEGPADEVHGIFARIRRDARHTHVTKLADGPVDQRCFAQWSMGFQTVNSAYLASVAGYFDLTQAAALADEGSCCCDLRPLVFDFLSADYIRA
ncbi:BLUF domain-containing protein [Hymenobacter nivis]|uniref:BLUF domain-containing protein n=1 Tax=Hymenobacter nivis TaxID=1850093 RepID=A0A502GN65_9BACT|nr:BLUF domain-containing protein [Hymenobacter nivis]TPG62962.1 BLUF domain-containing protein [Hymenobacter nivis]